MDRLSCRLAWIVVVALVATGQARATTYYVSPAGRDKNAGTTQATAWKTIGKVNKKSFKAGDRILFQGGATFTGGLSFGTDDQGTAASPITVSSYGTGPAIISAGSGDGLFAYNTAGLDVSNLVIVGSGRTANTGHGISFYADLAGNVKLDRVHVDNVDVSGFGQWGITIGSWNGQTGYRDVMVTNSAVHDNRDGLGTYAETRNVNESVYVAHVTASNNPGAAGATGNSGNGIVLGSVNGAAIERCTAYGNGWIGFGSVGIWTYDSTGVVIQYSESYDNHTTGTTDGGGFDLDQDVSNSVMQYNYSNGNDGAGYLLYTSLSNLNHSDNIVRYNISQNDGRKNGYAGIFIGGKVYDAEIYQNTIFLSPAAKGTPAAVRILNIGAAVHLRNNILQTTGGALLVKSPSAANDLRFEGNAYWASGSAFKIKWGSTTYSGLSAWQIASGQERVGSAVGYSVDPQLTNPGGGGTIGNPDLLNTLSAYTLRSTSPLIDAGLDLTALFGVNPGAFDFYGSAIPRGAGYDVGAHEF